MQNSAAIENQDPVKIYSLKNRLAASPGLLLLTLLILVFLNDLFHLHWLRKPSSLIHSLQASAPLNLAEVSLILAGIVAALFLLRIVTFPNVVMTEKEIKMGWKFGGLLGLSYRHHIPWEKIAQIDSGGARMIQWSDQTSIIYHTGKIPIGRSTDLEEAVISTALGYRNFCKIIQLAIERAPQAKIDQLTLRLMKSFCKEN